MIIVEVFKTDIDDERSAKVIHKELILRFPDYRINFDLDDCDNILRVESSIGGVNIEHITELVRSFNYTIDILQ